MKITLGEHVKTLREQRGWTQSYLCNIGNIHQKTLYHLERDETAQPSYDILSRLSKAFGLDMNHWMIYHDYMQDQRRIADEQKRIAEFKAKKREMTE